MSRWENFKIWRGRLPHWRADNVTYYATFRHRRELGESDRNLLLRALLKPTKWDLLAVCVLPGATEMLFTVKCSPSGEPYELSEVIERAKQKAGKEIIKRTGEKWPPFYTESFDRIIRDRDELEERWLALLASSVELELVEEPEEYDGLYVAHAPL
ncbi:MAG: hypothetical protein IT205_01535 [Fimbriimonadaceae bacterium]|nr:hypothetical protein [Fimbriimonadaceae bacterium]